MTRAALSPVGPEGPFKPRFPAGCFGAAQVAIRRPRSSSGLCPSLGGCGLGRFPRFLSFINNNMAYGASDSLMKRGVLAMALLYFFTSL